jgi:hypothetical protein
VNLASHNIIFDILIVIIYMLDISWNILNILIHLEVCVLFLIEFKIYKWLLLRWLYFSSKNENQIL